MSIRLNQHVLHNGTLPSRSCVTRCRSKALSQEDVAFNPPNWVGHRLFLGEGAGNGNIMWCNARIRASLSSEQRYHLSRRQALTSLAQSVLAVILGSQTRTPAMAAGQPALSKMEKALVPVVMCRTVMVPVRRYIEEGSWDRARTNVNYCTRNLALKRRIRDTAENGLQGDAFYDALETAGSLDNTMTQLDSSIYVPIFIPPADEGFSAEQLKYQEQARGFYQDAIGMLDRLLGSVPESSLLKAKEAAAREKFEIRVEKE